METHTFTDDDLMAGAHPGSTDKATIASGSGSLKRGRVLAQDGTGKLAPVDSSATTPGDIPHAVLIEDTDATNEVEAMVYTAGHFNEAALIFAEGDSLTTEVDNVSYRDYLRKRGIFTGETLEA